MCVCVCVGGGGFQAPNKGINGSKLDINTETCSKGIMQLKFSMTSLYDNKIPQLYLYIFQCLCDNTMNRCCIVQSN